jgi:hypothetical protein
MLLLAAAPLLLWERGLLHITHTAAKRTAQSSIPIHHKREWRECAFFGGVVGAAQVRCDCGHQQPAEQLQPRQHYVTAVVACTRLLLFHYPASMYGSWYFAGS